MSPLENPNESVPRVAPRVAPDAASGPTPESTSGSGPATAAPQIRSTLDGGPNPIRLPRRLPIQRARPAQSNIPNLRADRDRLKSAATLRIAELGLVPPISVGQRQPFVSARKMRCAICNGLIEDHVIENGVGSVCPLLAAAGVDPLLVRESSNTPKRPTMGSPWVGRIRGRETTAKLIAV